MTEITTLDLIILAFVGGLSLPVLGFIAYQIAMEELKSYINKEIREATR